MKIEQKNANEGRYIKDSMEAVWQSGTEGFSHVCR